MTPTTTPPVPRDSWVVPICTAACSGGTDGYGPTVTAVVLPAAVAHGWGGLRRWVGLLFVVLATVCPAQELKLRYSVDGTTAFGNLYADAEGFRLSLIWRGGRWIGVSRPVRAWVDFVQVPGTSRFYSVCQDAELRHVLEEWRVVHHAGEPVRVVPGLDVALGIAVAGLCVDRFENRLLVHDARRGLLLATPLDLLPRLAWTTVLDRSELPLLGTTGFRFSISAPGRIWVRRLRELGPLCSVTWDADGRAVVERPSRAVSGQRVRVAAPLLCAGPVRVSSSVAGDGRLEDEFGASVRLGPIPAAAMTRVELASSLEPGKRYRIRVGDAVSAWGPAIDQVGTGFSAGNLRLSDFRLHANSFFCGSSFAGATVVLDGAGASDAFATVARVWAGDGPTCCRPRS